ncbi:hypothetical protein ADUPG1_004134, partial [Aduncisulcus paluster]
EAGSLSGISSIDVILPGIMELSSLLVFFLSDTDVINLLFASFLISFSTSLSKPSPITGVVICITGGLCLSCVGADGTDGSVALIRGVSDEV